MFFHESSDSDEDDSKIKHSMCEIFFYFTTEDTTWSLPVNVSIHILYMLLLLHVNHFSVILMFCMGIKFCMFKVRDFFTIAKNAKLITNKAEEKQLKYTYPQYYQCSSGPTLHGWWGIGLDPVIKS